SYNSSGGAYAEYIWLEDTPVAVYEQVATSVGAVSTQLFYVHADHIDTPRVLQDTQGNTRWRWMAEPFGTTAPEEQPTASLPAVTFNLRMPGQQFEPFGGRFYNYFRDYEPSTGRYVQSDPIGLDGGLNTYAYAGGQPTSMVDRKGLFYTSVDFACAKDPSFCAEIMGQTIRNAGTISGNKCLEADANRAANRVENLAAVLAMATLFKTRPDLPEITLSRRIHGEAAEHAADAIAAGKPSILTIDRAGAAANRQAAIGALEKVPGKHLDEFPPAMFREGGARASVRPITPRDNLSGGACIGNACRGLPDGARVRIKIED
ncbi:MAG TPA: RHS repeat-associated core domain-containing protein, partial [Burkholderiaceae bacterium]